MKKIDFTAKDFVDFMLSINNTARLNVFNNIKETLEKKGLSGKIIICALKQIHSQSCVVVKRLSGKEISSHTRKKKKSSTKPKILSTNKIGSIDNSKEEDSNFSPVITSVISLQTEEFSANHSTNTISPALTKNKITKHNNYMKIDNSSGLSLKKNIEQLLHENNIEVEQCNEHDSFRVIGCTDKEDTEKARKTTMDSVQQSVPDIARTEEIQLVSDNIINNSCDIQKKAFDQLDNQKSLNKVSNNKSKVENIKLQESIKLKLINNSWKCFENNFEDKIKQNVYTDISSGAMVGFTSESSKTTNSSNPSNSSDFVQEKETLHSLDRNDKPSDFVQEKKSSHLLYKNDKSTNKHGDLKRAREATNSKKKQIKSLKTKNIILPKNRTDKLSYHEEPLPKKPFILDQMSTTSLEGKCASSSKSGNDIILKESKAKPDGENNKKNSLKIGSSTNKIVDVPDQSDSVKMSTSQALTECLIAKKRGAELNCSNVESKMLKVSTDKLNKNNLHKKAKTNVTISNSSQGVKEKSHSDALEDKFGYLKEIVNSLQEVLANSSKQNINKIIGTDTASDNMGSNNILNNNESLEAEVTKGPKFVDRECPKTCSSKVSERVISDCTVSSSSMIETSLEIGLSHDKESPVYCDIPETVSISVLKKNQGIEQNELSKVTNKQNLPFNKLNIINKECQRTSQCIEKDEQLITESVNLYLRYFEMSSTMFASVPFNIQLDIKSYIASKGNSLENINVSAVIKEYLTLYTSQFYNADNQVVSKTAEILHLFIHDYNRLEDRRKLAFRLKSDIQVEEINRANVEYEKALKLRGEQFSEMFLSKLNKFDQHVCLLLTITFYFKIVQALLHIDSDNIQYFNLIKNLIKTLLTKTNQQHYCFSFLNLSNSELLPSYEFVKNCLVTFHLARYRQAKSQDRNTYGIKYARFGPTSVGLKNMLSEFIIKHKGDSQNIFANPNSSFESINETPFESTRNMQSSTHLQRDQPHQNIDPGAIAQVKETNNVNISCKNDTSIIYKHDEMTKLNKNTTGNTKQQEHQQTHEMTQQSHFNQNSGSLQPKQILNLENHILQHQQNLQHQSNNHKHFIKGHVQQILQAPSRSNMIQNPSRSNMIQNPSHVENDNLIRILLQKQNCQATAQVDSSIIPQPIPHSLSQARAVVPQVLAPRNSTLPRVNQVPHQRFILPKQVNYRTNNEQNNVTSRTNLLIQNHQQSQFAKQNVISNQQQIPLQQNQDPVQKQIVQNPHYLQSVTNMSQQPTHSTSTQQRTIPLTQVPSQSTVDNQTSLPQIQNLFDRKSHKNSLQQSERSVQNESMHHRSSNRVQPPIQNVNVSQYPWPYQYGTQVAQQRSPCITNPANNNELILEHPFGSCAVRDCSLPVQLGCSRCLTVFYCSYECQNNHWYTDHCGECPGKR